MVVKYFNRAGLNSPRHRVAPLANNTAAVATKDLLRSFSHQELHRIRPELCKIMGIYGDSAGRYCEKIPLTSYRDNPVTNKCLGDTLVPTDVENYRMPSASRCFCERSRARVFILVEFGLGKPEPFS